MASNLRQPNFNWVAARAECSLYRVLKELYEGAKADAQVRNDLRQEGDRSRWHVGEFSSTLFTVYREAERMFPSSVASVDFSIANGDLSVTQNGEKAELLFTATLTLNNDGECRLKVNNTELEQWQLRRMALENLFFASR